MAHAATMAKQPVTRAAARSQIDQPEGPRPVWRGAASQVQPSWDGRPPAVTYFNGIATDQQVQAVAGNLSKDWGVAQSLRNRSGEDLLARLFGRHTPR